MAVTLTKVADEMPELGDNLSNSQWIKCPVCGQPFRLTALSTDSLAAKGLLRHSSVSTTERHYIKDVPESTLQAMKRLESLCKERAITGDPKPN
jgi:hypothetical protein